MNTCVECGREAPRGRAYCSDACAHRRAAREYYRRSRDLLIDRPALEAAAAEPGFSKRWVSFTVGDTMVRTTVRSILDDGLPPSASNIRLSSSTMDPEAVEMLRAMASGARDPA